MDTQLEAKLIECLDALAQGESVERILARYPQEAAQLRSPLETAAGLPALRLEPSEAAKMQSRRKFMAQADLLRRTTPRKTLGFLPRFATGFVAAALVALVLGSGAVAASGSALPGDPLYGLKRTVENMQLSLNGSATARESLSDQFAQRRRDEVNQLLSAGRPSEVEFTGMIEALQAKAWIVSSVVVQLNADTQIVGTPQINRVAEVRGVTGPNGLRANFISIESSGEPELTSTPEATRTPQATSTLKPTETSTPKTTTAPPTTMIQQPTVTPPPTILLPPSATPRPRATAQPTATPQPVEVEFAGSVNSIDQGTWTIDGTTVIIDTSTDIRGPINTGQRVKVKALRLADGGLVATLIELSESSDGGNNNANSNDNHNSNENQNSHEGNSNDGNSNNNDNNANSNSNNSNDGHNENTNGNSH